MMQKAGENINIQSASQKLKSSIKHPVSFVFFVLIAISVIFTVVSLGFLIGYILINGIPNLTPKLFAWHYTTENASMLPALINTIWMTILALVIAIPFGIGAAIYMVEYAKKGNKIVEIVVDLFVEKWGEGMKWVNQYDGGPHEANFLKLDCSKLKTTFGWKPRWTVSEALDKTVEWTKVYFAGESVADIMDKQIKEFLNRK